MHMYIVSMRACIGDTITESSVSHLKIVLIACMFAIANGFVSSSPR